VTAKPHTLYVSLRHVYERVEALKRAAGGPSVNGHWRIDCSCPSCGSPVPVGLAVDYNRRGYVQSHELSLAQGACPKCGARLSERSLLFEGVQPQPVEQPDKDRSEDDGGFVAPESD
jgi:hypothetical protein